MDYCFVDKIKDVQRLLAANMESLADSIKCNIDHKDLQHFHEFLCGYTDTFTDNIYATKDYTYNFCGMIQNKDIVVVKGDKDSSVVIMKKSDYVTKLDTMINDRIMQGTYVETTDNTIKGIVLVVHVTLVKLNIIQKLDGMNIIIQLTVQSHQNTCEATSNTILYGLSFKMLQKMLRPGRT